MKLLIVFLSFVMVISAVSDVCAVDSWNVELVGGTLGPAYAIYAVGNYAYLCAVSYLVILDILNPSRPAELGRIMTPENAIIVHVIGNYAYVAD